MPVDVFAEERVRAVAKTGRDPETLDEAKPVASLEFLPFLSFAVK